MGGYLKRNECILGVGGWDFKGGGGASKEIMQHTCFFLAFGCLITILCFWFATLQNNCSHTMEFWLPSYRFQLSRSGQTLGH